MYFIYYVSQSIQNNLLWIDEKNKLYYKLNSESPTIAVYMPFLFPLGMAGAILCYRASREKRKAKFEIYEYVKKE